MRPVAATPLPLHACDQSSETHHVDSLFEKRRTKPENLDQYPRARLHVTEWDVRCADESCGAVVADASWIDIQMLMCLNSPDEVAARAAMNRLPERRFRTYRMNVRFAPGWKRDPVQEVWAQDVSGARLASARAGTLQRRLIRGEDCVIDLRLEAETPAKAKCPSCGLLQVIDGHRRKGMPGTPEAPGTSAAPVSGLRAAARS